MRIRHASLDARRRLGGTPWAAALFTVATVLAATGPARAQIEIDNDLAAATPGYWAVAVEDAGHLSRGVVTALRPGSGELIAALDVLASQVGLFDTGNDGDAEFLGDFVTIGSALTGDDQVTTSGSFTGANGNTINWTAVNEIAGGSPQVVTTYTFTAVTGTLGILRFFDYVDQDILAFDGDDFFFRGSAAAGDLELFTIDDSLSLGVGFGGAYDGTQGLVGATFAGWAADEVPDLIVPLTGVEGITVSPAGEIDTGSLPPISHPFMGQVFGPADVAAVLAWDLDPQATTATIVTTLGGVPAPTVSAPAIPTLSELGMIALVLALAAVALVRLHR